MGEKLRAVFQAIDAFSKKAGGVVSVLALVLMLMIVGKVVARYVFNVPFIWSFPISRQVFGVFILFAGVYAMLRGAHLRVEVLYNRFPTKVKLYARLVDLGAFLIFIVVLIWQAGWMSGNSIINTELSQGTPKVPLYIIKTFIPVVAFLFLLEGISAFFRKDSDSQ
jgi:TRAP-type mannitol/chloroaromatic compound transport system permease small subunit